MPSFDTYRSEWFGNVRRDLLSGLVVALALIPEAIAFSIIAGVDPKVGLYASFSIAVITAITGGRPGMISAATAATAVLMVTLVADHGLQYLLAATVLAGVLQVVAGLFKLGKVMRFVSRSVLTGFVNALAILIFMAQIPELVGVPWLTYPMVLRCARHHLPLPAPHHRGPVTARRHRRADGPHHRLRARRAHRRRHGRTALDTARLPAAGHPADP